MNDEFWQDFAEAVNSRDLTRLRAHIPQLEAAAEAMGRQCEPEKCYALGVTPDQRALHDAVWHRAPVEAPAEAPAVQPLLERGMGQIAAAMGEFHGRLAERFGFGDAAEEPEQCEGCGAVPVTCQDADGVPLCQACGEGLAEEAAQGETFPFPSGEWLAAQGRKALRKRYRALYIAWGQACHARNLAEEGLRAWEERAVAAEVKLGEERARVARALRAMVPAPYLEGLDEEEGVVPTLEAWANPIWDDIRVLRLVPCEGTVAEDTKTRCIGCGQTEAALHADDCPHINGAMPPEGLERFVDAAMADLNDGGSR